MEAEEEERRRASADEGEEPLLPGETKTFAQRATDVTLQIERELNSPVTATAALPENFGGQLTRPCKPFIMGMEQVTEIGFMNSREFQTIREQLYLTALTVTAERFSFIAQPFATEQLVREQSGTQSADGKTNRWVSSATTGFTKLFSTGALLLFNFANQTVYNLGGGGPATTSVSTASLDFIQPFLAGGGRAVALEPLTQSERNLLYAIRDFYRRRQEFFVFFAAGQPATFIPGVGAGVVALNPGTVATAAATFPNAFTLPLVANPATVQVSPQPSLAPILNSGVLTTPQGYLSTILERANLVNYYKNIQALQRFLRLFEVFLEGGLINQVQKGQIEQQLLQSIEQVLGLHLSYRVSLDQLKQQLGLPITIPIELDPAPLQPMINLINSYEQLSIDFERVVYNALNYGRATEVGQLRERLHRLLENTPLMRRTQTRERTLPRWAYWEKLERGQAAPARNTALRRRLDELLKELEKIRDVRRTSPGEALPEALERRLEQLRFEYDIGSLEYYLSVYETEPWRAIQEPQLRQERQNQEFRRVYQYLLFVVDKAFVERQQGIKESWPPLPPIRAEGVDLLSAPDDVALAAVERTTMATRVDLMNVRAQLTDGWRKIRVAANALMGTFNVDYHVDASSPTGGSHPFAIGGSRTRHELIFTGQLPLVRILQRNNYRSTLIFFQQVRRSLMAVEDQLMFNVRLDLRQMRVLGFNYQRIQKRQIELAYMQVDQALQAFNQPQAPPGTSDVLAGLIGPVGGRPAVGDPAALTSQLLSTQGSLLRSQNDLYSTWATYIINRMYLYRDMGVLFLDNRGVWIDEDSTSPDGSDASQPGGRQSPTGRTGEQLPEPRQFPPAGPEQLPAPRSEPAAPR
jgi:hypothetical protein